MSLYKTVIISAAPAGFFYVAGHLLRIVAYETVTYDQAGGACSAFGQLVRIDTPEIQTAIESFVTNPANGESGDFICNGIKVLS